MWNTLGIEPTNDIKKIKSAYAALAKKYNPEEYPEEFRKLHDAYKKACDIARGRRPLVRGNLLCDIPRRAVEAEEAPAGKEPESYDLGGVDTSGRRPPVHGDVIGDIPHRTAEAGEAPAGEEAESYDFGGVDTSSRRPPVHGDVIGDIPHRTAEAEETPDGEEAESYDFGAVDIGKEQASEEEERLDSLRIAYLERIHRIISCHTGAGSTRLMWEKMFREQGFWDIVYDPIFRSRAAKIFVRQNFDRATAARIAEVFGCGAFCRVEDLILNSWRVVITPPVRGVRRVAARLGLPVIDIYGSRPSEMPAAVFFAVVILAVVLMIVCPVIYASEKGDPDSGSSYEESISPAEILTGTWVFNSGGGYVMTLHTPLK